MHSNIEVKINKELELCKENLQSLGTVDRVNG